MATWYTFRIARINSEGRPGGDSYIELAHLKDTGFLLRESASDRFCFIPSTLPSVEAAAEQWGLKPARD